jgi:hypothetical protein
MLISGLLCVVLCACQTPEGGVMNKVLTDWGIKSQPEGHVSESDQVFKQLATVGPAEMKRMNDEMQHGQVKFQKESDLKGKYYKEVKVYESFYPVEAKSLARNGGGADAGFEGYIEYSFRMYQSMRKSDAVEAEAETASIPTDTVGRDLYRYHFKIGGEWDGGKGEKAKR